MNIQHVFNNIGPLIKRNSSTILTGLGVAGSVGALILGVKATPNALSKLEVAYLDKNADENTDLPLTKVAVIKIVWRDYASAVALEVVTIACVIGAQSINLRKQAAVISAFSVTEAAFREYQERITAEVPTKDRKVRDDMAKAKMDDNPVSTSEIMLVGNGDQLFYESHTDRYFMSTMQKVQKAVNDLNFRVLGQNYASLNEFYSLVGLKTVSHGDEIGWTSEHALEVDYSTQFTDDDRAAIVLDYHKAPLKDYWKGFQ